MSKAATTEVELHPLLAQRWSPRAFDPAHEVADAQLTALLEAARWAPSSANSQPWRFLVTRRGEEAYDRLLGTLNPGNQLWAGNASLLVLAAAEVFDDTGTQRKYAWYDTGQAVAHLSVQAEAEGLSVHQLGGFDAPAASEAFALPDTLAPTTIVAIGVTASAVSLPEPLAAREVAPRQRRPLVDLVIRP